MLHFMRNTYRLYLFLSCALFFFQSENVLAQKNTSYQFWPEIDFTSKPFNKSTIGIDIYSNRESSEENTSMFAYQSSMGGKIWYNHYFKSKVKTSAFFEPIYTKANPESGQSQTMEYRLAIQNIYYSPFKRWTLQNRIRIEDRIIEESTGNFVHAFRPRYLIKAVIGLNKKVLIKGTWYMLCSNEIMFNTGSSATGYHIFDRNLTQVGLGYCITDYISLETQYAYTIRLSANNTSSSIEALSLTLSFNNIFSIGYFKGYFNKNKKDL
jgi:hypothetical protein